MSTIQSKVLCSVCKKGKGTFKCEGCSNSFCPGHSIEHRNELSKQLEEIEVAHDLAYRTLTEQIQNLRQHSLIEKVDQWEYQSIEKIRRMAEETRDELLKGITEHTSDMKRKLQNLSDELRQGREDNDFLEDDLEQWMQKLERFQLELLNPMNIMMEENATSLVNKIRINRQNTFESNWNNSSVQETGQLLVKEDSRKAREIRGKTEYQIGSHTIRFQVEQLIENGWIAFGIISKSEQMQNDLCTSPSSYAWSNQDQIYLAGQITKEETIEIIQNDIVELFIDCDQQKIELKNERSHQTKNLSVHIEKCPFPWLYYTDLRTENTRVRIQDSSD